MPAGKNIAVDISWWWMGIFHSAYCGFVRYTNGGSLLSKVISYQVGLTNLTILHLKFGFSLFVVHLYI